MNKQSLRIRNAQSALFHFFHYHYCTNMTIKEINDETVQNFLDEMNDLVVGAVISETTTEKKIFLHGRYGCNESFIKCGRNTPSFSYGDISRRFFFAKF